MSEDVKLAKPAETIHPNSAPIDYNDRVVYCSYCNVNIVLGYFEILFTGYYCPYCGDEVY